MSLSRCLHALRRFNLDLRNGRSFSIQRSVYDPVGMIIPSLKVIAWNGRIVVVGFAGGAIEKIPSNLSSFSRSIFVGMIAESNVYSSLEEHRRHGCSLGSLHQERAVKDCRNLVRSLSSTTLLVVLTLSRSLPGTRCSNYLPKRRSRESFSIKFSRDWNQSRRAFEHSERGRLGERRSCELLSSTASFSLVSVFSAMLFSVHSSVRGRGRARLRDQSYGSPIRREYDLIISQAGENSESTNLYRQHLFIRFNLSTPPHYQILHGVAAFNPFCARILVKSARSSICSSVLKAVTIVARTEPTVTCVCRTSEAYQLV